MININSSDKPESKAVRRFLIALALLTLSIMTTTAQEQTIFDSPWSGDYFNNPYLAGDITLTRFDQGIGFDWGNDAPVTGLPQDNFSIRWGKVGDFPAGTYRFIITADYGFRLYIDGEIIIDTWDGSARGETIGRDIFIEAGYHTMQLDYYSLGGDALIFVDWGLAPNGQVAPQSTDIVSEDTIIVTANTLNVRSAPRIANNITARIARGQQFLQLARSEDDRWVQIDLGNGTTGWVNATFITRNNAQVTTDGLTGQSLRSTTRLLVRAEPNIDSDILSLLLSGEDATIIGRSADGNWWQINDNGSIGWVNALFVVLSPQVNIETVPISD